MSEIDDKQSEFEAKRLADPALRSDGVSAEENLRAALAALGRMPPEMRARVGCVVMMCDFESPTGWSPMVWFGHTTTPQSAFLGHWLATQIVLGRS